MQIIFITPDKERIQVCASTYKSVRIKQDSGDSRECDVLRNVAVYSAP